MAQVIAKQSGKSIKVPDGGQIRDYCKKLGVPFDCTEGICGTCMIDIVEGEANLNELNDREKGLGRDRTHRLACQAKIKKGTVKIDW